VEYRSDEETPEPDRLSRLRLVERGEQQAHADERDREADGRRELERRELFRLERAGEVLGLGIGGVVVRLVGRHEEIACGDSEFAFFELEIDIEVRIVFIVGVEVQIYLSVLLALAVVLVGYRFPLFPEVGGGRRPDLRGESRREHASAVGAPRAECIVGAAHAALAPTTSERVVEWHERSMPA